LSKLGRFVFHQITNKRYVFTPETARRDDAYDDTSTARFLGRFGGNLDFGAKTVLDVGCGTGVLCAEAARLGARRVVGTDLAREEADENVRRRFPEVADRVSFVATKGDLAELGDETFDLVVSKDAMEHFSDPDAVVAEMIRRVAAGGELVIGFGPLWRSPWGGHIDYMTRVPWAHLMFSEETILAERRRFRPREHATRWSEISGGLNQMTLKRFTGIMDATGLQQVVLATNVSDNRGVKVLKACSRFKPISEFTTVSVYGIWRRQRLDVH
jgi:2-polyprenyl-3-methyl-5-hydroxy-6-metoxy-1,4-benzoquinol methylase